MIINGKRLTHGGSSKGCSKLWRSVWSLEIPPRIKLFAWRICRGVLPCGGNIAKRLTLSDMRCSICGFVEESDIHALLECSLAAQIWESSCFDQDYVEAAGKRLEAEAFGDFVAVLWECWNARNRFIFRSPDQNLAVLSDRAISFIKAYREFLVKEEIQKVTHPCTWHPPPMGMLKLNVDTGSMRTAGGSWGFVVLNGEGDIVLAGCKQSSRFLGSEIEEAKACLFGLQCAKEADFDNLIIEGDCLPLIQN
ncbi:hypothetical protein Cgig2_018507 [Carnegiea gigantea]|uniref:Reverse transcriptase zinc-binding domain-containing protein n=1 Tax=Carnegiea gigantea TaxID=171969 RepID=A0A9Q1JMM7_9CARY|nr:hypothetical protein Cgig2_018507 [Carnegiea gigantea]